MTSKFFRKQKQLDAVLRQSAERRRKAMATEGNVATVTLPPRREFSRGGAPSRRSASSRDWRAALWVGGLAAAASALLMFGAGWFRPATPTAQLHAGEFSQQLTAVPGEVLRLLNSAAATSQTRLPQLSPLASLSVPELPGWNDVSRQIESPMQREINAWQTGWDQLRSRLSSQPRDL